MGVVLMYFMTFHIVLSSASLTNFRYVVLFACLIFALNAFRFSFHNPLSSSLPVLILMFLCLLVSFQSSVISSFHHPLLKGLVLFRGVVSSIARVIADTIVSAIWSTVAGVCVTCSVGALSER